jgi:FdhE protein
VPGVWDRRIRRAEHLAADATPAASLLAFYARLLRAQQTLYDALPARPSGCLDRDLDSLRAAAASLLRDVEQHGPDPLVVEARAMLQAGDSAMQGALLEYWRAPSDDQFFAKAILQPYGQRLADAGIPATDRPQMRVDNRCPRCGGAPQLSILDGAAATSTDSGSRKLLCADCLTPWPFRRVVCPQCGEEDERKLGYFHSPAYEHLRLDICETCRFYLKSVDLGRSGLAVPLVDEVAGVPLDVWARERGYEKIELNLVGV